MLPSLRGGDARPVDDAAMTDPWMDEEAPCHTLDLSDARADLEQQTLRTEGTARPAARADDLSRIVDAMMD